MNPKQNLAWWRQPDFFFNLFKKDYEAGRPWRYGQTQSNGAEWATMGFGGPTGWREGDDEVTQAWNRTAFEGWKAGTMKLRGSRGQDQPNAMNTDYDKWVDLSKQQNVKLNTPDYTPNDHINEFSRLSQGSTQGFSQPAKRNPLWSIGSFNSGRSI